MKKNIHMPLTATLFTCTILLVLFASNTNAQTNKFPSTGAAGIGTTSPNASSLLEIKSTTKGFLAPRMTQAQRNAIASPATGLLIYQTNNTTGFYFYSGTAWTAVTPAASGWSLTGNAGTDSSKNFVGTKDAHPLAFRVNNKKSGWIDYTGNNNTSLGYQTLLSNTTGANNAAFGFGALKSNIAGGNNTAIGASALFKNGTGANVSLDEGTRNTAVGAFSMFSNTTGLYNTSVGTYSLASNTSGYFNTALGVDALQSNTNGRDNTATGLAALDANVSGNYNTASGSRALEANTSGEQNTASGYAALNLNSSGSYNTATGAGALNSSTASYNTGHGAYALYLNTSGSNNTANGFKALYSNTTGQNNTASGVTALYYNNGTGNTATGLEALHFNTSGNYNTANGLDALLSNETGVFNTAIGYQALLSNNANNNTASGYAALYSNTSGADNVANGVATLLNNTSGGGNTAIGENALAYNNTGNNNTALGVASGYNASNFSNTTSLGAGASATTSNQVRIGNGNVTSIGGYANWTNISDGRVKKNIKQNVPGLVFINKLNPVTYNLDLEAADKIVQKPSATDKNSKLIQSVKEDISARKIKEDVLYTGFVAQEVEQVAKSLNYNFSGVDAAKNDKDLYGLRYAEFVVPLVKAVQELSAKNDDLQKQIDNLKAMIAAENTSIKNSTSAIVTDISLDQNKPNPFTNSTTIGYTLPQKFTSAQIIITDKNGKTLKQIIISGSGKGTLNVDAATLASGAYNYSLIVDGKIINTKQMLLAK